MPETTPAEPQGGTTGEAQGATGTQAQGATGTAQGAAGDTSSPDVTTLTAKIAELERDNRAYRLREKQREEEAKAKATAGLSEAEQLRARVAELETANAQAVARAQEQSLRVATITAAAKLGFSSPEVAVALVAGSGRVEWGDDGQPTNVDKLLAEYVAKAPGLVQQPVPGSQPRDPVTDFGGGPRGSTPATGPNMNDILRAAAKK